MKMKRYLTAIALGIAIGPALGATIYGALMGNPFIIFYPIVLAVAYIVEGIPFAIFGAIGSLFHRNATKQSRQLSRTSVLLYGLIMGTLCGSVPLLFVIESGYWEMNRSILSFIVTGSITGMICASAGNRFLNRNVEANHGLVRTGDPQTARQSAQS